MCTLTKSQCIHLVMAPLIEFREMSNSYWEGIREGKTHLKKVIYTPTYLIINFSQLVSQNKIPIWLYACIEKKGCRRDLCHQFLAGFLLGEDVLVSHIELDRHS